MEFVRYCFILELSFFQDNIVSFNVWCLEIIESFVNSRLLYIWSEMTLMTPELHISEFWLRFDTYIQREYLVFCRTYMWHVENAFFTRHDCSNCFLTQDEQRFFLQGYLLFFKNPNIFLNFRFVNMKSMISWFSCFVRHQVITLKLWVNFLFVSFDT